MKSDLDLIIEFYENEKRSLEQEIKEALTEHDYEVVYHRGEALNRIEAQLYRLNLFKYPLFDRIQHLENLIDRPFDSVTESFIEHLKDFHFSTWEKRIDSYKEEVERLKTQKPHSIIDTQEIDNALFDLYGGKCKALGFCFPHRGDNLCLLFELTVEKILLISVDLKDITSDYDPDDPEDKQTHLFENLGFRSDEYGGSLVYKYDMNDFKSGWEIKILLSRLVYDIGYFGGEKEGTIEFYN